MKLFWLRFLLDNHLSLQPFSQKPRTPTVTELLQIGLHGVAEADL